MIEYNPFRLWERIDAVAARGILDPAVVDLVRQAADGPLVMELEHATDDQLRALNAAYAARQCEHRDAIDIEDFSMEPPSLAPVITVTGRRCIRCQAHLPLPDEENPQ